MASDPKVVVRNVLSTNWDGTTNDLASDQQPDIGTGSYDRDQPLPVVTMPTMDEGPLRGGDTGITATHGPTGKPMARLSGFVLVDAVAGTWGDLEGAGTNGEDLNPKKIRWQLYDHATQILHDNVPGEFYSLMPTDGQELVDDDEGPAVFRWQFRARYLRDRIPNG